MLITWLLGDVFDRIRLLPNTTDLVLAWLIDSLFSEAHLVIDSIAKFRVELSSEDFSRLIRSSSNSGTISINFSSCFTRFQGQIILNIRKTAAAQALTLAVPQKLSVKSEKSIHPYKHIVVFLQDKK